MEVDGLPLHPLVVHLALGSVLLAGLLAVLLALVPGWRWATRWGALGLSVVALVVVLLTRASGESLLEEKYGDQPRVPEPLQTHQDRADLLLYAVIALLVVVVLAFVLLPAHSGLATGRLQHEGSRAGWVRLAIPALLVVAACAAMVVLALTGHAGATSVWGTG